MSRTRSGRQIKKPDFYEPEDTDLVDDFGEDDYDSEIGSDIETDEECYSDEESDLCESDDEDINGNLKGFVVEDEDESEEE